MQFEKNELVFAKCGKFPPWPARIKKAEQNGTYKVSFFGESSYAHCYPEDIFVFTDQKAQQIQQLYIKKQSKTTKMSKAFAIGMKQYQAQKEKEAASQEKIQTQSKIVQQNSTVLQTKTKKFVFQPASKAPVDPAIQLLKVFDNISQEILQPTSSKSNDLKDQQTIFFAQKQQQKRVKHLMSNNIVPYQKVIQYKIIQKLISLIKIYDTFHLQCQTRQDLMLFLKQKYQQFHKTFNAEIEKKKSLTHRDRTLLFKFQNFKAFT